MIEKTQKHRLYMLGLSKFIMYMLMVAVIGVGLYWLIQITTACSFHTPSGSMSPTLLPDESGLVNKWKMGARIFNIFDAIKGKPYEITRLPGSTVSWSEAIS